MKQGFTEHNQNQAECLKETGLPGGREEAILEPTILYRLSAAEVNPLMRWEGSDNQGEPERGRQVLS